MGPQFEEQESSSGADNVRVAPAAQPRRGRGWSRILVCGGASSLAAAVIPLGGATAHSAPSLAGSQGLIVFEQERPAGNHTQTDLLTVSARGTGVVQVTATPGRNEFGPAWSPTGARLAFWRTRAPFGPGSLWVVNGDGSGQRRLATGVDARDPSWNPVGTRLVYSAAADDLFTLRVSRPGHRRQLTSGRAEDFEPAWSPDGAQIAFTRGFARGDPGDLYRLTLATHAVVPVTRSAAYDHQVAWAPGGHRLVFERDFPRRSSIFTVRPDGSGLRQLTRGAHFDTGPTFSPNGQLIVFGSDRGSRGTDLWVMDRDGGNLHRLLHLRFLEGFPDWTAGVAARVSAAGALP